MSETHQSLHRHGRANRLAIRGSLALGILAGTPASGVLAAVPSKPTVPAGFKITKISMAPKGIGNCDDLAFLEGHLFLGCQNKALSNGGGGNSTFVEFDLNGKVLQSWSIKDKIDGVGADPLNHRLIVTLDEDANTHLATITPSAPVGKQITNYAYAPDPHGSTAPIALRTGGGTDNVSVDSAGHIFITGSHAGTRTGTAVFQTVLTPPSSPGGVGTATLSPTFLDNATAVNGKGGGSVKLALGDVDSGAIVPASSPRFGGSYVIDDQTALELVFANDIFKGTGLTVLKTPFGLDDIRWATSDGGTLYVVDKGAGTVGQSALYMVTGPFVKNTVLAANDGQGDQVVKVNLDTGALTPFVQHLNTTKGLVYLDPSGTETQLALNGSGATAASGATTTTGTTSSPKKSGGSSNTALIVVIIAVALLLVGGGGFAIMSRRKAGG